MSKGEEFGWKLKKRTILSKNPWTEIISDDIDYRGQREINYVYVKHPGAVFVVPVTKDGKIVLIRNYRWVVDDVCWEVPAGVNNHPDANTPEQLARLEMKEEAGCEGGEITKLAELYSANGICNLRIHVMMAVGVEIGESQPEETEDILEVAAFSCEEIEKMIDENKIEDGDSALCLLLALRELKKVKES